MIDRPRGRSAQNTHPGSRIKSRRTLVIGAIGLLTAFLVAWVSLPIPLTDANPLLAARIAPKSGTVLAAKATTMMFMKQGNPEEIKEEIKAVNRQALLAEPLAFHAASGLGLMSYLEGDKKAASKLFGLVGGANLRDKNSHAMLLQLALDNRQPVVAIREAEILMRQRRSLEPLASQVLTDMVARGLSIPQLVDRLAERPSWRSNFLAYLGANGKNAEQELKVYRGLAARGAPARGPELDAWLLRQVGKWSPTELVGIWRELQPRDHAPDKRFLRSGDLDPGTHPRPFEWVFYVSESGSAAREKAPQAEGMAMLIEYHGGEGVTLARQWTDLSPGRYRLQARARSGQIVNEVATFLMVSCVEGGARLGAVPVVISEVDRWFAISVDFEVPKGCAVQSVDLRGEGRLQGSYLQYYLDDFAIMPAAA